MTHNIPSFIDLAIKKKVLQFGEFTTKAGRKSPYFLILETLTMAKVCVNLVNITLSSL
jgi:orotate phosphoribosyltransferase